MSELPQFLLSLLASPPKAGEGVHSWLYCTARQLHVHCDSESICRLLKDKVSQCGRAVPEREIRAAVKHSEASAWWPNNPDAYYGFGDDGERLAPKVVRLLEAKYRPPKPAVFEPDYLARIAGQMREKVNEAYLAKRSKFSCHNRSPAGFLHKLYRAGEKIIIFTIFESQGQMVWTHPGPVGDLSALDPWRQGFANVWFLAQPVDGQYHWNPREEKDSRRSGESVRAYRYAVIESDTAEPELWLKVLVQLPLPIAAIYSSGKRSIHTLIRIDAQTKMGWDAIVRTTLKPALTRLGADPGAMTAVRLSRLPNCRRG